MEKSVEGFKTLARGGSNIKKPHLGLMRKNNKTINRKACVFPTIDPTINFSNAQKKASLGNSLWFNSM
jgi:hypothetical protein